MPFLLSILLLAPPQSPAATPAVSAFVAKQELRSAVGAVLRGQGAAARTILLSVPSSDLDATDRQFRACALSRLNADAPTTAALSAEEAGTFVRDLLLLYRAYWRSGALDEAARPAAERALIAGLARLLGRPALKDVDEAEPLIAARLKAAGLFSREGRTGVFHDLMIWRRDTQRVETVPLPEGANATQVNYLDGFISRGWSSYFTCDRTGTGGWTTNDGLFVIVPSYDSLTNENFRVNFLAHESQHYSDKKRFGDMPSWRLEYRAKLVELVYADTTHDQVLDGFNSNQGDDTADPHSYANKRVLEALERRLAISSVAELHRVPIKRLHEAAAEELRADSSKLTPIVNPTS
jgi:hypothetical protein